MASPQDIEKLKRNVHETWEEAFQGVDRTSEEFHQLVEEFVNFVGDWKEFSDIRRDRLADYIESLGDVQSHWKDINGWVEENSDTLETYVGSLSDIRDLFHSISAETGGLRRQALDRLNLTRSIARLAEASLVATKQEGGLTERVVTGLRKKGDILTQQYLTQLKILGIKDPNNGKELKDRQDREIETLNKISGRIRLLERLQRQGVRLSNAERAELRNLQEEAKLRQVNIELLDSYNKQAIIGLQEQLKNQQELFRIQRRGGADAGPNAFGVYGVTVASKLMRKAGMVDEASELQRDYGEWVTKRVEAKQRTGIAVLERQEAVRKLATKEQDFSAEVARNSPRESELSRQIESLRLEKEALERDYVRGRDSRGQFANRTILSVRGQGISRKLIAAEQELAALQESQANSQREIAGLKEEVLKTTERLRDSEKAEEEIFKVKFSVADRVKEKLVEWANPLKVAAALATAIFTNFLKTNAETAHVKQLTGEWTMGLAGANFGQASILETTKLIGELTKEISLNPIAIFDSQELGRISEAKKLLGLTADQAAGLGVQSKLNNTTADEYRKSLQRGIGTGQILNKTVISQGVATREALAASDAIKVSMGNNAEAIGRAVVAAKSLGMNLQDVENIAKSLMNFESSIEAEMQAQLLTGHQLNLAKAREYALNNDLEGVAREIKNQGVTLYRFGHLNYIQQENMAKALGMSREQMAKMLVTQALSEGISAKQIANAGLMNEKQIEAISLQENWNTILQRMVGALTPILQLLLPIAELVAKIAGIISGAITWMLEPLDRVSTWLSSIIGKWTNLGALVRKVGDSWVGKLIQIVSCIGLVGTTVAIVAKTVVGGFGGGLLSRVFGGLVGRFGTLFGGFGRGITRVITAPIRLLGKAFSSLGINAGQVLKGAAAMAIMSLALIGVAKALQMMEGIGWDTWSMAAASLTGLAIATVITGKILSKAGKGLLEGAAAMVIIAGALWVGAKACQEFAKVSWEDVGKAGVALAGLVTAVIVSGKALAKAGSGLVEGALHLALFGLALIPVAFALRLATPAFNAFANIIQSLGEAIKGALSGVADIITVAFGGIVGVLKEVTPEKALGLHALGVGFTTLGVGLLASTAAIALFPTRKFRELIAGVETLTQLAGLDTGLSAVAVSINKIAQAVAGLTQNFEKLDVSKVRSVARLTAISAIASRIAKPSVEVQPEQNTKDAQGIQKENITTSVQEITVKQAEIQASTQRISVEQKAADLSRIEKKMESLERAIINSRPNWNWLEYSLAAKREIPG